MNNSKNYVQVEIPKVPRWLDNVLTELQTKNYRSFKTDFSKFGVGIALSENRDEKNSNIYVKMQRLLIWLWY